MKKSGKTADNTDGNLINRIQILTGATALFFGILIYLVDRPADEEAQDTYIKRLLSDADALSAEFVTLFFTRDYDDFWESDLKFLTYAQLIRTWKDTGLYDGLGNPRPALDTWHQYLNRSRQ